MTVEENRQRANKNICKNCLGLNWLIQCSCGYCDELIFKFGGNYELRLYKKGHHMTGHRHPNWNNGVTIEPDRYIRLRKPNHPNAHKDGYIYAHIFIMSEYIGRPLIKGEDVHHKDGNRHNNDISNLELLLKSEHTKQHKIKDRSNYFCSLCGNKKTYYNNKYNLYQWYKNPKNKTDIICGKCYKLILYYEKKKRE